MFEWFDSSDNLRGRFPHIKEALVVFQEFSKPGDYVWDTDEGAITIANVTTLIEEVD